MQTVTISLLPKRAKFAIIWSMGLIFKLDIGLLQISSRTACQRYRQHSIDANPLTRVASAVKSYFAVPAFATVPA